VGCDWARSRVRELAGIAFPGTTYPDVHRLGQGTLADDVTVLGNGDIGFPGSAWSAPASPGPTAACSRSGNWHPGTS
jgi:hypothetical protein